MNDPPHPPNQCPDLEDYLNREGSRDDRKRIEEHLMYCQSCQEVARSEQWIHDCIVEANQAIDLPVNLASNMASWKEPASARIPNSRHAVLSYSSWIAAACVLALLTFIVVSASRSNLMLQPTPEDKVDMADSTKGGAFSNGSAFVQNGGDRSLDGIATKDSTVSSAQIQIDQDWLIASHPSSDEQIEVYIVRPVLRPLAKREPSQRGH